MWSVTVNCSESDDTILEHAGIETFSKHSHLEPEQQNEEYSEEECQVEEQSEDSEQEKKEQRRNSKDSRRRKGRSRRGHGVKSRRSNATYPEPRTCRDFVGIGGVQ